MEDDKYKVLRKQNSREGLWFYRKTVTLYELTKVFTQRFLPQYGDRTVDQMVQAARSGKQNIIEGSADGVASSEMEIKLLNTARGSIQELQEDYVDYLRCHQLSLWDEQHSRFKSMIEFCRKHNDWEDYKPFVHSMSNEEMANVAYTLCRLTDRMMTTYLTQLEAQFVTEGGIKERMTAARTGFRADKKQELDAAYREIASLKAEIARLNAIVEELTKN